MAAVVLTSTEGLSRDDWLAYRRLGIGGSDASVVCGVNKYKSPLELWMEKTGRNPPGEAGEAAYWGTRLESLVREEFTLRTGIKVIPVKQIAQSRDYPFMLANLDGVCRCPTYGRCVFEAKTASAYKADEWAGNLVPLEYVLQIQHYLAVTGYNGAYIAALIGGNSFQWKFVERDEELISLLIRYERDFWMCVQDGVPPAPDGSDACTEFISKRYPIGKPNSKIELPAAAYDLIIRYTAADSQLKQVKEQKQKAGNLLKEMLGENETGTVGGSYIKWTKVNQERFDSGAFESEQPELYKKYMRESSHRRFTAKVADTTDGSDKTQGNFAKNSSTQDKELLLRKAG